MGYLLRDKGSGTIERDKTTGEIFTYGCTGCNCGTCYCGTDETHTFGSQIQVVISGVTIPVGICQFHFESDGNSAFQYSIEQLTVPINATFCLTQVGTSCNWTTSVAASANYWASAAGCQSYSPPDAVLNTLRVTFSTYHRSGVGTIGVLYAYLDTEPSTISFAPVNMGFYVFYFHSLLVPGVDPRTWDGATFFDCNSDLTVDNYAAWYKSYIKTYGSYSGITYDTDPGGFCGGWPYIFPDCSPEPNSCPCPGNPYGGIAEIIVTGC